MVLRGMRAPKDLAKKNRVGSLKPLSPDEIALFERLKEPPIVVLALDQLRISPRHARVHSEKKVNALAAAVRRSGVVAPIYIDKNGEIIDGAARWLACRLLAITRVPTISVEHLSDADVRALRIGMGRFPEWADWDFDVLRIELPEIIAELPTLSMEEIGFTVPEFDRLIAPSARQDNDPADSIPPVSDAAAVSRPGDLWQLGRHLVLCGDALSRESYDRLLGNAAVRLVLSDPPYNVKVNGHVTKRIGMFGEFAMASGELSVSEFREFLRNVFVQIARVAVPGSMGYFFIDWRHARLMQEAADGVLFELKNHIVWVKETPGLGTFYRSQHEFVLLYKLIEGKHINNFELGQHGRTRSNVWHYAGMNSFGTGRNEALEMHVTPKPVGMLVEAILDCSNPGDLVLDPFGGSGATLMAAERTCRQARLIEINPTYVDTIVRRWTDFTGQHALLIGSDQTFAQVAALRAETTAGAGSDKEMTEAESQTPIGNIGFAADPASDQNVA